jgi:hypothetical protein
MVDKQTATEKANNAKVNNNSDGNNFTFNKSGIYFLNEKKYTPLDPTLVTSSNSKGGIMRSIYFGGGFFGFDKEHFKIITDLAVDMINEDEKNKITPVWHDESVLNAILASLWPTKILTPSYHWPENNPRIWESWSQMYECKILLLDKNHSQIRK